MIDVLSLGRLTNPSGKRMSGRQVLPPHAGQQRGRLRLWASHDRWRVNESAHNNMTDSASIRQLCGGLPAVHRRVSFQSS